MDQQLLNNIVQAAALVIAALASYLLRNLNKIKAETKDNQMAQSTVDIISKVANYAVHELENGDLDNAGKRERAVSLVSATLSSLGLPSVSDKVIAGAVESAVSAMHLAWDKGTVSQTANDQPSTAPQKVAQKFGSETLQYDPGTQVAMDDKGAAYTVTHLGSKVEPTDTKATNKTDDSASTMYPAD